MKAIWQEALDLLAKHGSYGKAAKASGIAQTTIYNRCEAGKRWQLEAEKVQLGGQYELPPEQFIKGVSTLVGEDGKIKAQWIKTQKEAAEQESLVEGLKEAFSTLTPTKPLKAPPACLSELLTLYPIADAHIGMLAWGLETGEDYNTELACLRLKNWMGKVIEASPKSETAIILDVGDLMHADDQTNTTPGSGHQLDVDTRFFRTVDMTVNALVAATDLALRKHKKVIVRILPGNHNKHAYIAILFALASYYRDEPRVEVQKKPGEFFAHQFGDNMICAHHGDKGKAQRMVLDMADSYASMWGATKHRFLWTGHLHHHKSEDIGGVQWEQLRALTAKDAYARSHAYCARAQLQAVTYHREKGEVSRVKVSS